MFAAGSLLDWLAARTRPRRGRCRARRGGGRRSDSAGVIVLPALAGLGAPWWRPAAHGVIAGLHPAVGPAHVAHAALEAIAWRVADIVEAMAAVVPIHERRASTAA